MKLIVGFITYREHTAKYLPYFLDSLRKQTFADFKIFAVDNSEEEKNENKKFIKNNYPEIIFSWAGGNLGFAKAHNIMINKAKRLEAKYFLALNPDIILETNAIEKLVALMDKEENLGSASPKILQWDFINKKKTNIIDTGGIIIKRGLKFVDLGQGVVDRGQFDKSGILGPSGAAGIYRLSSLEEYFDELMFMYKEDCDLAYRLYLAGFKAKLAPEAIIYHDRTVSLPKDGFLAFFRERKDKDEQAKKWSFLNQHIIFLKYWHLQSFINKIIIILRILAMFVFVLFFEQYLLKEYGKLWKIRKKL